MAKRAAKRKPSPCNVGSSATSRPISVAMTATRSSVVSIGVSAVDESWVFVHPAARDALSGSEKQSVQVFRHFSTHNDPKSCPYPHW